MLNWAYLQHGKETVDTALILALLKPQVRLYDWTKEKGTWESQGSNSMQIKITPSPVPASDKSFLLRIL